jgi:hypothetical protein
MNITDNEKEMLIDIMNDESDGVGMGYSGFDGKGLNNLFKGVLSSLIQKGLVYDSEGNEDMGLPMYCSCKTDETVEIAKGLGMEYPDSY